MKRKSKVNVITLGCSKNTVDSERLMKQIQLNNISMTENTEEADTVIINTMVKVYLVERHRRVFRRVYLGLKEDRMHLVPHSVINQEVDIQGRLSLD